MVRFRGLNVGAEKVHPPKTSGQQGLGGCVLAANRSRAKPRLALHREPTASLGEDPTDG
jgi:hypothetical protein